MCCAILVHNAGLQPLALPTLLTADVELYGLRVRGTKCLGILYHQRQVATASRSEQLQCHHTRLADVLVDTTLHMVANHGWEHGRLGVKRSVIGIGKRLQIACQNSVPAVIGSFGERLHLRLGNVLTFHDRAARAAWLHRY